MTIEGKKIYLSSITYDDTDSIIEWRNKEFVREQFIYRELFTRDTHINWMKKMVETGKVIQFIICLKENNKKIGSVYLRDIDAENRKCEFGIFIGEEDCIGCGYGREAAELICSYAFEKLGMYKVFLRVLSDNIRAQKSYKKSGFEVEGKSVADIWIDGRPIDVIFMAKFKENKKQG